MWAFFLLIVFTFCWTITLRVHFQEFLLSRLVNFPSMSFQVMLEHQMHWIISQTVLPSSQSLVVFVA